MKVQIIDGCIACDLCSETCPEVFKMGDDGLAHPIADTVPAGSEDCAKEAADTCPVTVILLTD